MRRWRRLGYRLALGLALAVLGVLLLVVAAGLLIQTSWAHERLRALIVSQANRYLTATLDIGRFGGSLFRGVELENVRLSRDGQTLIAIDRVDVSYSIRELVEGGTVIRRLSLTRPRIVAGRLPDGRWDLAALIKRDTMRPKGPSGPGRPITIDEIDITDGAVTLRDPLEFGAAHVPTVFTGLNTMLSFSYRPVAWTLDFTRASFNGAEPALDVRALSGAVGSGDDGWVFRSLHVVTPRSEFTLDGRIDRRQTPTRLDLVVNAPRFAFQEWGGVLHGLRNIAVDSAFDARLSGPPAAMQTSIALRSTRGDVRGDLVLDTTVEGWHARGSASVARLDLAHWLNRPDRPSDITGDVTLDLDLQLGGHFPVGSFAFRGSHAAYLDYEADEVTANGTLTPTDVRIARATATAYGANVRLAASTLGIDSPNGFHFVGTANGVDLRQVPKSVPVPHVESTLAFDYDVTGQFSDRAFIRGGATFGQSEFLGAQLSPGATGSIDTGAQPFHYAGEGDIGDVDLHYFGEQLQIAWLTDPRYAGTVRGHFHVDGVGSEAATMTLNGGGRLAEGTLFSGRLENADVGVSIAGGSLEGSYDGTIVQVDPAIPMADPLYSARLTGRARGHIAVRDLLVRSPEMNDYTVDAVLDVNDSTVRGIELATGHVEATLADGAIHVARMVATAPGFDAEANGTLELDGVRSSSLDYHVTRSDLAKLDALLGPGLSGEARTSGRLTGPLDRMRFTGEGTIAQLGASGVSAVTTSASYDVTIPTDDPSHAAGQLRGHLTSITAFGQPIQSLSGDVTYDAGRVTARLDSMIRDGVPAVLTTELQVDIRGRQLDVDALSLDALRTSWRLSPGARPHISWTDNGAVSVAALQLTDAASGREHVSASGTWAPDGGGALTLTVQSVAIDPFTTTDGRPARYGGLLEATAVVSGTRDQPVVSGTFVVTQGRIRRLNYERFAGRVEYRNRVLDIDVRLDQAPGVWLTGTGTVPMTVFERGGPEQPIHVLVKSSPVSLTLVEGVTDLVRNVGGQMALDVTVVGTSRDPHFVGLVNLTNASFEVASSGARYKNGRVELQMASDRVAVQQLHFEDDKGHPLDVTGSLGTHELRVGDLQVAVRARDFEVLRNEYGRVDIDARLSLAGEFESPRLTGALTVTGGQLNVDRILDRALFQPYSTQETPLPEMDPIVALNPWERMGLDIELHVPGTLRMLGENVQVTPGTPLGLGDINLRAFGDISLYKDPAQPMYVNGSFDSLVGTYVFQGRRFDLDPASSINFRGDLNPELYLTVNRVISGVETRVSIIGPMRQPELRLASTPPLEPSDILSLIVFNTSTNELSALQQQQLAVRAGTLAAGFLAAPMVSALERTLGIDTLEIEPGADIRGGPKVTVGNEIAPGLVARFSRQFGQADYDEATLEYYLTRLLRIRATFSDAGTLTSLSPFRRVERAGIDLLLFFSF